MKILVKLVLIVFIAFVILSFAHDSYAQNAGTKLKRGVINFFTGWYEIPVNIKKDYREQGGWGIVTGPVKGLFFGLARMGAGVWDTLTFPIPAPAGYEPLMKPEYAWENE